MRLVMEEFAKFIKTGYYNQNSCTTTSFTFA